MQLQPLVSSWTQKRADALISYERPAEWPFLQEEIEAGRSHSSGRRDRDRRPLSVFTKLFFKLANEYFLDEIERSIHDSLCVVKRVLESKTVVAGGGAVEVALSIYLDDFARTLGTREQLAIAEFSEALLIIPKTLAMNAAKDATELIAKLRVLHNAAQQASPDDAEKKALGNSGLDLLNGKVRNNLKAGVLEPGMSKVKSLKFATEAAITILRIDDMIKLVSPEQDGGQY